MDAVQNVAVLVVAATAFWFYLKLKERVDFLSHEVRWLRKELEALKPTEIKSVYDQNKVNQNEHFLDVIELSYSNRSKNRLLCFDGKRNIPDNFKPYFVIYGFS